MRVVGILVLVFTIALGAFCLGYLTHRNEWVPVSVRDRLNDAVEASVAPESALPPGEWYPHVPRRESTSDPALSGEDEEALAALGYLPGYEKAPNHTGVTMYKRDEAQAGLNLYISGHKPEAFLIDMEGQVIHTWSYPFEKLWPHYSVPTFYRETGHLYWRRVYPFPNGDLLAIHQGIGLIKLDRDSNLLWSRSGGYHHDLDVDSDGNIYVLYRTQEELPNDPAEGFLMDPYLVVLDPDGNEFKRISLVSCFENSPYAPLLKWIKPTGDIFHDNTLQVFDGSQAHRSPLFERGKVLISIWTLDTAAIVNPETETVEWAATGRWRRQHEPMLLDNGNMLVFDNRGNAGRSRIVEFNPLTLERVWTYQGAEPDDFYSKWCGAVQRLDNGHTLITETNNGRTFEVTPNGDLVWEFINPHQVDLEGVTLVASLWEVIRLPSDFGADWLRNTDEQDWLNTNAAR